MHNGDLMVTLSNGMAEALDDTYQWEYSGDNTSNTSWSGENAMDARMHMAANRLDWPWERAAYATSLTSDLSMDGRGTANTSPPYSMELFSRTAGAADLSAWDKHDKRPAGCEPDAIKIFVGNVPKSFSKGQLLPFFNTFGKVEDLVIVKDKTTHESKGSAFLWFATREAAERAIQHFNQNSVVPDDAAESNRRPLVLREAKACNSKGMQLPGVQHLSSLPLPMRAGMSFMHLPQVQSLSTDGADEIGRRSHSLSAISWPPASAATAVAAAAVAAAAAARQVQQQSDPGVPRQGSHSSGSLAEVRREQLVPPASRSPPLGYLSDLQSAVNSLDGTGGAGSMQVMSVNLTELTLLLKHLFSVQTISGAQISMVPAAPDLYSVFIGGAGGQNEMAKVMISSILANTAHQQC